MAANATPAHARRILGGLAIMLLGPTFILTSYAYLSRGHTGGHPAQQDWLFLGLAAAFGLIGVSILPLRNWTKFILALLYVPLIGALQFLWLLIFVCAVFEDCL